MLGNSTSSTAGLSIPANANNVPSTTATMTGISDPGSISSSAELANWVNELLDVLESRMTNMSDNMDTQLKQLGERIDTLDQSLQELLSNTPSQT